MRPLLAELVQPARSCWSPLFRTEPVEFFVAVANNAGLTLHIRQLAGVDSHPSVEACFKAFARALRLVVDVDPRRAGPKPSSKGGLKQAGA